LLYGFADSQVVVLAQGSWVTECPPGGQKLSLHARVPEASLIIPTYNRSHLLRRALSSALSQSFDDLEVVVVDDGSTDDTAALVGSFTCDRLAYHRDAIHRGKSATWLKGFKLARGRFVTWLSDDDVIGPDFIGCRVSALQSSDDSAVAFSDYETLTLTGERVRRGGPGLAERRLLEPRELLEMALSREWFLGASLYSKDAVTAVVGKVASTEHSLDLALNVEIALSGARGWYLPLRDFVYTDHPGQTKYSATWPEKFDETRSFLERVSDTLSTDRRVEHEIIRRELSNWYVIWGRRLAELGDVRGARVQFLKAIKASPRSNWPWRQLVSSFVVRRARPDAGAKLW
jgi:hypothetical protein